jgi:hypothetical protein
VFELTEENLAHWKVWWRRANVEHFLSFYVLCLLSLALFCLVAATLLEPGAEVGEGFDFIRDQAANLGRRFGPLSRQAFLAIGIAVLFTTELAVLDAVSRVAADLLKITFFPGRAPNLSQLYFAVVWALIAFGTAVLLVGFDQPLSLLILSAALNGFVMFLYSGLLLWLNLRSFSGPLRPHWTRILALGGAVLFFGYFSVLTLVDQLSDL